MQIKCSNSGKLHDHLFRTPIGAATFPHLLTPDTRFDAEAPKFKLGLVLTPDEERIAREALTALYRKAYPEASGEPHLPFKTDNGRTYLLAKSAYAPKLVDTNNQILEEPYLVRAGHRVSMSGRARPFKSSFVTGVTLYLAAVTIHEPLDTLEIYRAAKAQGERPFLPIPEEVPTPRAPTFEDDLPF